MKVGERLSLIDRIGRELQARYTFADLDAYLTAVGVAVIDGLKDRHPHSKWSYAKAALTPQPLSKIIEIAEDLGLTVQAGVVQPPANWRGTTFFRLFISHVAREKFKATRLKECLVRYAIAGFVAHEDIHPTLEWQSEIERALFHMDAFIAIHTPGFSASVWTQQEIGFAVARGVKIISLKMGEDPTGFISKRQALARLRRTADQIADEVDKLLSEDPTTRDRLSAAKVALLTA